MDPAGAWDTELAWQLLTVLIRLGHPAAAPELASAAAEAAVFVSPQIVERICSIPGSPLRFSVGVVNASETAIVAFLRFAGWDFPAPPMVSWKSSEERRRCGKVPIRHKRKRKASDARGCGVKKHLLMEADADLVEHKQQLTVQSYFSVPTTDVRFEDMQDTLGAPYIVEPSKSPNGVTLVPSIANISDSCVQPELDHFLGGSACNELGNMSSALVTMELPIPSCVDIPLFCVEKPENIHAAAVSEISKIGEPEGELSLNDCRVEDSDDYEKESILPMAIEAAVVVDTKVGIGENNHTSADNEISRIGEPEEALSLYNCRVEDSNDQEKESILPMAVKSALVGDTTVGIEENIHATADNAISRIGELEGALSLYYCRVEDSDNQEKESTLPMAVDAALVGESKVGIEDDLNLICKESISPFLRCHTKADAVWYDIPNTGYCEEIPSCGQSDNACAEIHKNNIVQVLLQSPKHTKEENIEILRQPSVDSKDEHAALPLEMTSFNCIVNRNLNIIAENRENTDLTHREQTHNEVGTSLYKKEQSKKILKQREKGKKNDTLPKGNHQLAANAQKDHEEPKPLPSFKDFVVEEEEGSGGYGIVYRARRKSDDSVFAIKCPHTKAHSHHIDNERKMLERFGGKNFVIKYERSLKSGELDCFVLEHVEHDRPENLKKEINLFELQWYGYCLFKALSSLHKQRIVHRDVKPGNFLFSRRQMKGYLIDFNLANDLHQKFLRNSKSETTTCEKDATSQSALKSALVLHAKETKPDSKQSLVSKRKRPNKSPLGSDPRIDNKSRHSNQHADVSGVTSAKDPTSAKTSFDRSKQPLYKGRKELMNFLHETMHSPNKNIVPAPVSQRKRIAAPVGCVDGKLFILTPMPLRSGSTAVAGSGIFNSRGHGKERREGPCVGTKGFRAPEVLLRSFHQGCKMDVWSAGVTLLYLIIGKTPFGGDPEQNLKEIAKIRGSEELWEVAKLHNCESSYPSDLFDVKSLNAVDLREWCAANARRPDFLSLIPDSLFDLVDMCLAVNPRCRITSDEALMHEFFAPCRESLRKQKMLCIKKSAEAAASHPPPLSRQGAMVIKANKS